MDCCGYIQTRPSWGIRQRLHPDSRPRRPSLRLDPIRPPLRGRLSYNAHPGRPLYRRWTISFMGWEPFADNVTTLAQLPRTAERHTAAVVDTPFYWRHGFNYDRGFQTFFTVQSQEGSPPPAYRPSAITSPATSSPGGAKSRTATWPNHDPRGPLAGTPLQGAVFPLCGYLGPPRALGRSTLLYRALHAGYDGEVVQPIYADCTTRRDLPRRRLTRPMPLTAARSPWWTPGSATS